MKIIIIICAHLLHIKLKIYKTDIQHWKKSYIRVRMFGKRQTQPTCFCFIVNAKCTTLFKDLYGRRSDVSEAVQSNCSGGFLSQITNKYAVTINCKLRPLDIILHCRAPFPIIVWIVIIGLKHSNFKLINNFV